MILSEKFSKSRRLIVDLLPNVFTNLWRIFPSIVVDQSFNYLDHWFVYIVMYRVLRILMIWLIDVNYAIIGKGERGARISPQGMV